LSSIFYFCSGSIKHNSSDLRPTKDVNGDNIANYSYVYAPYTNKLMQVKQGTTSFLTYEYNASGQMKRQKEGATDRKIAYNAYGLVKEVRDQPDNPSA
jgi:hypothetical protein